MTKTFHGKQSAKDQPQETQEAVYKLLINEK